MAKAASHVDGFIKRLLREQGKASDAASRVQAIRAAVNKASVPSDDSQTNVVFSGELKNASLESQLLKLYAETHRRSKDEKK